MASKKSAGRIVPSIPGLEAAFVRRGIKRVDARVLEAALEWRSLDLVHVHTVPAEPRVRRGIPLRERIAAMREAASRGPALWGQAAVMELCFEAERLLNGVQAIREHPLAPNDIEQECENLLAGRGHDENEGSA